ncbi:MAG: YggU family protein [Nanoarchaeota archaeon]|nr:YggU family protein [Nanoarchaeota archaeon]
MDPAKYFSNNRLKVIAKPNSSKTEILGWDEQKKALRIAIAAPADKNKANRELVRFLSKRLGKKVCIKSGLTSKEKVVTY